MMRSSSIRAAIAAIVVSTATGIPAAQATTLTYSLNGSYAEDSNSGPSLVPYGGTLGPTGYSFGVNEGLSLSGVLSPAEPYSIELSFYFDSVTASFDLFQRILDFKNRTSDTGLYSVVGFPYFYCCDFGHPEALYPGEMADLLVTRDASGIFSVFVNGSLNFSFLDNDTPPLATFSGPDAGYVGMAKAKARTSSLKHRSASANETLPGTMDP